MKDETKDALGSAVALGVTTCLLGPFSLFFVPDAVKSFKRVKEDRLTREAQARIDDHVAAAEAEIARQIAADRQAALNAERAAQREAARLECERVATENRLAETYAAVQQAKRDRELERVKTQTWLDNYYAERKRRRVRLGILPRKDKKSGA